MNAELQKIFEKQFELISRSQKNYEASVAAQVAVWEDKPVEKQPLLMQCGLPEELDKSFPDYRQIETHYDKDKMLLSGMKAMLRCAWGGMQAVPSIRANMGCGIFASMFPKIAQILFEDGKMPWVKNHLSGDEIRNLREKDITVNDEFKMGLEHMAYMRERIEGCGAFLFPLDLQGPVDTAHLVYGDKFFYDLYDDPDLIHHLLDLSCCAIEKGMEECFKIIPRSSEIVAHYNDLVMPRSLGGVKLSEDTTTLLGPKFIDEYATPYIDRVLKKFGGGYIHYCGKNDHLFDRMVKHPLVRGINFGNPDKHDMDEVLQKIAAAGKIYYGSCAKMRDEDDYTYFSRVLKASAVDGKRRLLLTYSAPLAAREKVCSDWERACANT